MHWGPVPPTPRKSGFDATLNEVGPAIALPSTTPISTCCALAAYELKDALRAFPGDL